MNMQATPPATGVQSPPQPRSLAETGLSPVMMRDILLKTIFRKNVDLVSDLSKAICLPIQVTQELVDMARDQRLLEATGTLNANNGNEMGYQLTDQGKARALDALAQSRASNRKQMEVNKTPFAPLWGKLLQSVVRKYNHYINFFTSYCMASNTIALSSALLAVLYSSINLLSSVAFACGGNVAASWLMI